MQLTPQQKYCIDQIMVWNLETQQWVKLERYMRWVPFINTRYIDWDSL